MTSSPTLGTSASSRERLTPWILYDLERVAWIVEARASELTEDEQWMVEQAATRLLAIARPTG